MKNSSIQNHSNSVDVKGADNLATSKFTDTVFCSGSLSKKIDLDVGGTPYSNRTWSSLFAVVRGSAINFYKSKGTFERLEAPSETYDLDGAVVAHIKDYKGKRDILILRFRNGQQILLDSENSQENTVWRDQIKSCLDMLIDYKAAKLLKEREGSVLWLAKLKEKYGINSGAPPTPEAAIAVHKVEDEIEIIDAKLAEIRENAKKTQSTFQDAASTATFKNVTGTPVFSNSLFTNSLFEGKPFSLDQQE